MQRYHKQVYFPIAHNQAITALVAGLNAKDWSYSQHCLDNLDNRDIGYKKAILEFIKDLEIKEESIFEYYYNNGIEKIVCRIPFDNMVDIILVISNSKNIITIYTNDNFDKHYTLNKGLYQTN